jgi:putative PIN family toxin of toxin-antitoxin system
MARAVIAVVFDSSVVAAATCWRGESYLCLVSFARRRLRVFASLWILEETRRAITRLQNEQVVMPHDPWPVFNWFASKVRLVSPAPTGKRRSRDPNDDPILGTALASSAKIIVTLDNDLLALEKPFGIDMITSRQLLARLQRPI